MVRKIQIEKLNNPIADTVAHKNKVDISLQEELPFNLHKIETIS